MKMPILPGLGGAPKADAKKSEEADSAEEASAVDMDLCEELLADVVALNDEVQAAEVEDDAKKKMADFVEQAQALHDEVADAKEDDPEAATKLDELNALADEAKEFAQGLDLGESEEESLDAKKDPSQRELQPSMNTDRLLEWAKS